MSLYEDEQRASADVKSIAADKIQQIDRKLLELQSLKETLEVLVHQCHGDEMPDCPIIDDISGRQNS